MMVPSSNFIRWLGLAALIGGGGGALLGLLGTLLFSYLYSPLSSESEIQSDIPFYTDHIQLLALLLGAMAAIAALHTLQRGAYGLLGKLTSLTAFLGVALIFGGAMMELLVGIGQPYSDVISMLIILPLILGLLAATIGIVALGTVTISARMLPWWVGLLVILGNPLFAMVLSYSWAGVAWALVGYALLRQARVQQHTHPPRVS